MVEAAQDILEELKYAPVAVQASPSLEVPEEDAPNADEAPQDGMLAAMGFDPVSPDALAVRCKLDVQSVHAQLLVLELEGAIELLPGGLYRRVD